MAATARPVSLVDLPAPCLLVIMQHCSSDDRSLFSAARAHSTLRSAAAAALSSITLEVKHDGVIASLLAYLSMHGQYIEHVVIRSNYRWRHEKAQPLQFPPTVQLMSLKLQRMPVALCTVQEAGPSSFRGVLTGQARLKQLSLQDCIMREGPEGLAAALQQLRALEHLDVQMLRKGRDYDIAFPGGVLPGLQALTFLQLAQGAQGGLHDLSALPDVAALTGLLDLRLHPGGRLTKDVLAPLTRLTSLCLAQSRIEAGALQGKPHLQHLNVAGAVFSEGGSLFGKASVLLSELQHLQKLTYLNMWDTLRFPEQHGPPVEAYAAITASSKLQHLNIANNKLAKGFWGQLFNPNRPLLQLRELAVPGISCIVAPPWVTPLVLKAADVARLVSCCPGLRKIQAHSALQDPAAIAALSTLVHLEELLIAAGQAGWLGAVAQLTGLTRLDVFPAAYHTRTGSCVPSKPQELLPLTQLKCLAWLHVVGDCSAGGSWPVCDFKCQVPEDEPVWRQLQHYCNASSS